MVVSLSLWPLSLISFAFPPELNFICVAALPLYLLYGLGNCGPAEMEPVSETDVDVDVKSNELVLDILKYN